MHKVYIDPGHGDQDGGASGRVLEKTMVLDIGREMRAHLKAHWQVDVRMSRDDDTFLELHERSADANSWGADVFISIHCNAGGGEGFESYRYSGLSSSKLQQAIHPEVLSTMRKFGRILDRGMKSANFSVLRETNMDAVLTENLFVDSNDAEFLKRPEFRKAVGQAHARGVAKFLDLTPIKEEDVPLSRDDVVKIWSTDGIIENKSTPGSFWTAKTFISHLEHVQDEMNARQKSLDKKLDALLKALSEHDSSLAARIDESLSEATINVDVNVAQGEEEPPQ